MIADLSIFDGRENEWEGKRSEWFVVEKSQKFVDVERQREKLRKKATNHSIGTAKSISPFKTQRKFHLNLIYFSSIFSFLFEKLFLNFSFKKMTKRTNVRAHFITQQTSFFGVYVWVCQRTSKKKKLRFTQRNIYIECRHFILCLLLLLLCRRPFLHLLRKWLLLILGVDIMKCDLLLTCNSHRPLSHSLSFQNEIHMTNEWTDQSTIDKHPSCSVQLANFHICHIISFRISRNSNVRVTHKVNRVHLSIGQMSMQTSQQYTHLYIMKPTNIWMLHVKLFLFRIKTLSTRFWHLKNEGKCNCGASWIDFNFTGFFLWILLEL